MSKSLREVRREPQGIWGKRVPGRGHSRCKGPEEGVSLARLRKEGQGQSGFRKEQGLYGITVRAVACALSQQGDAGSREQKQDTG